MVFNVIETNMLLAIGNGNMALCLLITKCLADCYSVLANQLSVI